MLDMQIHEPIFEILYTRSCNYRWNEQIKMKFK